MGGAASEVTPQTRELLLEAATFSGPRVRRMALALGLRTEASSRHEKGLAPGLELARRRARGAPAGTRRGDGPSADRVRCAAAQAASDPPFVRRSPKLLGVELSGAEMDRALRSLGFTIEPAARPAQFGELANAVDVFPPFWRNDVAIREDIVEEIGRVAGYDRIPAVLPPVFVQEVSSKDFHDEHRIAHSLISLGYRETVNFALQPASVAEALRACRHRAAGRRRRNPKSAFRRPALPALFAVAGTARAGRALRARRGLRFFELGHVFEGSPEPFETAMVSWLFATPRRDEPEWRDTGFLEFKGDSSALLAHLDRTRPGNRQLAVRRLASRPNGAAARSTAATSPRSARSIRVCLRNTRSRNASTADSCGSPICPHFAFRASNRRRAFRRSSATWRSIVAKEIPALDVEHAVREGGDGVLAGVQVFDEYRGPQIEPTRKASPCASFFSAMMRR